jgi:hypothetical protein
MKHSKKVVATMDYRNGYKTCYHATQSPSGLLE